MIKGYKYTEEQKKIRYRPEVLAKVSASMMGRPSPFKGKKRWTEEQKKAIGDRQRGKPESEDFKKICSERMKGVAFFKGHKQSEKQKSIMRARTGEKHYNFQGKNSTGENKGGYTVALRRKKNGFTQELFEQRLKDQDNKCGVCGVDFDESIPMLKKSADHNHKTNSPRGILCRRCNIMIGNAKENVQTLKSAITYLDFWKRSN